MIPLYSLDEVAQILYELFDDYCACNYCCNDEWLPKYCDYENECPEPNDKLACWKMYILNRDKKSKE